MSGQDLQGIMKVLIQEKQEAQNARKKLDEQNKQLQAKIKEIEKELQERMPEKFMSAEEIKKNNEEKAKNWQYQKPKMTQQKQKERKYRPPTDEDEEKNQIVLIQKQILNCNIQLERANNELVKLKNNEYQNPLQKYEQMNQLVSDLEKQNKLTRDEIKTIEKKIEESRTDSNRKDKSDQEIKDLQNRQRELDEKQKQIEEENKTLEKKKLDLDQQIKKKEEKFSTIKTKDGKPVENIEKPVIIERSKDLIEKTIQKKKAQEYNRNIDEQYKKEMQKYKLANKVVEYDKLKKIEEQESKLKDTSNILKHNQYILYKKPIDQITTDFLKAQKLIPQGKLADEYIMLVEKRIKVKEMPDQVAADPKNPETLVDNEQKKNKMKIIDEQLVQYKEEQLMPRFIENYKALKRALQTMQQKHINEKKPLKHRSKKLSRKIRQLEKTLLEKKEEASKLIQETKKIYEEQKSQIERQKQVAEEEEKIRSAYDPSPFAPYLNTFKRDRCRREIHGVNTIMGSVPVDDIILIGEESNNHTIKKIEFFEEERQHPPPKPQPIQDQPAAGQGPAPVVGDGGSNPSEPTGIQVKRIIGFRVTYQKADKEIIGWSHKAFRFLNKDKPAEKPSQTITIAEKETIVAIEGTNRDIIDYIQITIRNQTDEKETIHQIGKSIPDQKTEFFSFQFKKFEKITTLFSGINIGGDSQDKDDFFISYLGIELYKYKVPEKIIDPIHGTQ